MQTCIVHLIRQSRTYVSWKECKPPKAVSQAPTEDAAAVALDAFVADPGAESIPGSRARSARRGTGRCRSRPIRLAIYTTNATESLNSTVRRAIRTRGHLMAGIGWSTAAQPRVVLTRNS